MLGHSLIYHKLKRPVVTLYVDIAERAIREAGGRIMAAAEVGLARTAERPAASAASCQHCCPIFTHGIKQSLLPLTHIGGMKVVALVAGLLVGGSYIDSHYFHGYYFRAALSMAQQIATHTGLRR